MRPRWEAWVLVLCVTAVSGPLAMAQEIRPLIVPERVPAEERPAPGPRRAEASEDREVREEPIETDRDSFTPATNAVGLYRLLVETSFTFESSRRPPDTYSFPELLLRYGLFERVELRLGWNYETGGGGSDVSGIEGEFAGDGSRTIRESRMLYGAKLWLTDQETWRPESSVILQGFTPTSGPETATAFQAAYVFGWRLANRWKFDSVIRYEHTTEEGDRFATWAPGTVLKVPIGEHFTAHAEYFGLFSHGKREGFVNHFFSPGVHFLATPNLEIGVRVGWGLNDQTLPFFCNVGLGARF